MSEKRDPHKDRIFRKHTSDQYSTVKLNVQRSFTKLVNAATKDPPSLYDLGPHTMRKTLGSWAVQAGATLQQVKEVLGHSTIMITERLSLSKFSKRVENRRGWLEMTFEPCDFVQPDHFKPASLSASLVANASFEHCRFQYPPKE
jgi:integrase